MKKMMVVIMLSGILMFVFDSCKLLDVKKDITFDIDLVVNEPGASIDKYDIFDVVSESPDIEDYKDLIKSIEVIKVEYTLIYFNGPDTQQLNSISLEVADEDGEGRTLLGTISNENLKALTTTTKELPLDDAGADRLAELIMESPHIVQVHYFGSANSAPMDYIARIYITVKMTANPL